VAADEKERDWDKEMAEVDRLLKKLPYAEPKLRSGAEPTVKRASVPAGGTLGGAALGAADRTTGREWIGTWARVALGLLVGIGMTQWPYTHGCGPRLMFYLVGVVAVLAAGAWSSISSWRRRLGLAHVLSQGLIVWGLVLAAREVLPRVGYAKASAPWLCPDVAPPH
jgi:hypothetical protein